MHAFILLCINQYTKFEVPRYFEFCVLIDTYGALSYLT